MRPGEIGSRHPSSKQDTGAARRRALAVVRTGQKGRQMPYESSLSTLKLQPMTPEEAAGLARRLLASYPSQRLNDPEGYIAELVSVLSAFPQWAGENATRAVRKANPQWLPGIGQVESELNEQVHSLRYAAQFERDAQEMRKRLAGPDFSDPAYRARMLERLEALKAELREADGKKRQRDLAEIRAEMVELVGQAVFDAIPDAPAGRWPTVAESACELLRKAAP